MTELKKDAIKKLPIRKETSMGTALPPKTFSPSEVKEPRTTMATAVILALFLAVSSLSSTLLWVSGIDIGLIHWSLGVLSVFIAMIVSEQLNLI